MYLQQAARVGSQTQQLQMIQTFQTNDGAVPATSGRPSSLFSLSDTKQFPIPNTMVCRPTTFTEYTLNEQKPLSKKRAACDRPPYKLKFNTNSITITINVATYEIFVASTIKYLNDPENGYQVEHTHVCATPPRRESLKTLSKSPIRMMTRSL